MPRIITLTTDFGTRDSYLAEMKVVILSLAPEVRLVDVTHEIRPHAIVEGALVLEALAACSPEGTIHLAVVDPGVGTARRGLAVVARGQLFVGPDNGLFTPLLVPGVWRAFELAAPEYRRPRVSRTFHGRDVFAPAAAHLALGLPPERLGPAVSDPILLPWAAPRPVRGGVAGTVIHVDRFGNLITTIDAASLERARAGGGGEPLVRVAGRRVPLVATYGDLPRGGVGALLGSRERLEIVVREGSAAARLGSRPGASVVLSWTMEKGSRGGRRRSQSGSKSRPGC